MKFADLLFELGVEELPSKAVLGLSQSLATNIEQLFIKYKIKFGEITSFGTPRRLAVVVRNVAEYQEKQKLFKRGPSFAASLDSNNNPLPSLLGFAKSCGVEISKLTTQETDKGKWWVYEAEQIAQSSKDLFVPILQEALSNLPIAKLMTWGDGANHFSRPVHWGLLRYGNEIISASLLGIITGGLSFGHRFHSPNAFAILHADDYENALYKAKVIPSFAKRRLEILNQIESIAANKQLHAIVPDELLDEVTAIVEWPVAMLGSFSNDFLKVPEEVLIASMQQHQKCFALRDKAGMLAPFFITIANIASKNPNCVVAGNEKVIKARLSDAAFFYEQDCENLLSSHIKDMEKVIFHVQLGSLSAKAKRIANLSEYLSKYIEFDVTQANRASILAKCDLLTGMVGEFPELQGVMGYYYAINEGESNDVALAIKEHYYPRFSADSLPSSHLGLSLSIADRIDTLVGFFAIGKRPSGMKDPFKLRRHALALVRMLIRIEGDISLNALINKSKETYIDVISNFAFDFNESLCDFIVERMYSYYQAQNIEVQFLNAVKSRQNDCLFDIDKRIAALTRFQQIPEATFLASACKRVTNILLSTDLDLTNTIVNPELFIEDSEKVLFIKMEEAEILVDTFNKVKDYDGILNCLASLKCYLDGFFDNVMVMVEQEDIKLNRLSLLFRIQLLLNTVADISLL